MTEIMTFSQCLHHLMKKYQFTATSLSTLIGGGKAELKKILTDDSTEARRTALYESLKNSRLFSQEDYEQMETALEVSRIGSVQYQFQQDMRCILEDNLPLFSRPICLDSGITLQERLQMLSSAQKVEVICFNCCFHSVMSVIKEHFSNPEKDISMFHFVHADAFKGAASGFVSVVFPMLFDKRYKPYAVQSTAENRVHAIGGNILSIRAHYPTQSRQWTFLVVDAQQALELESAEKADIFSFCSKALRSAAPIMFPLKEIPAENDDFSSLCMNYLSHELNRATYSITNDLCFFQTPSDIAQSALIDKAMFSEADTKSLLDRTLAIHEQRYQNHYQKRKYAYQVMSFSGCENFLKTGMFTDHFFGFRSFTLEERKRIFGEMLRCAREHRYFVPLLFKDHSFQCQYNLFCYEKLGVSFDKTDTDYDLRKGNRSIFLNFTEFTNQYLQFFTGTLVKTKCHSAEESLALLEEMFSRFLVENNL